MVLQQGILRNVCEKSWPDMLLKPETTIYSQAAFIITKGVD